MPIKCTVSKSKRPREQGQSSTKATLPRTPVFGHPTNPQRILESGDSWKLLQDILHDDLEWMLANKSLPIRDFLDHKLASYPKTSSPHKTPTDLLISHDSSSIDTFFKDVDSLPENQRRWCVTCSDIGNKARMAKCRHCHHWSHTYCVDGTKRHSRHDPKFSFWLCPNYRPDPLEGLHSPNHGL